MMTLLKQYKAYLIAFFVLALVVSNLLFFILWQVSKTTIANQELRIAQMEGEAAQAALAQVKKVKEIETKNQKLLDETELALKSLRTQHEITLSQLGSDYNSRMRSMQERLERYSTIARDSTVEVRNLANHTARLDRSLEEGRQLVVELRAGIKLRDQRLVVVGELLQQERALRNE